eukprot:30961-Pelagococcus_subviridis.AAC.15
MIVRRRASPHARAVAHLVFSRFRPLTRRPRRACASRSASPRSPSEANTTPRCAAPRTRRPRRAYRPSPSSAPASPASTRPTDPTRGRVAPNRRTPTRTRRRRPSRTRTCSLPRQPSSPSSRPRRRAPRSSAARRSSRRSRGARVGRTRFDRARTPSRRRPKAPCDSPRRRRRRTLFRTAAPRASGSTPPGSNPPRSCRTGDRAARTSSNPTRTPPSRPRRTPTSAPGVDVAAGGSRDDVIRPARDARDPPGPRLRRVHRDRTPRDLLIRGERPQAARRPERAPRDDGAVGGDDGDVRVPGGEIHRRGAAGESHGPGLRLRVRVILVRLPPERALVVDARGVHQTTVDDPQRVHAAADDFQHGRR